MKNFPSFCLAAIATLLIANGLAQALETQIISPNAYKVPYLGFDGVFNLNAEQESVKDPRKEKVIAISKMEKFTFYKDVAKKTPIARDCHYTYMGAAPDPKYYSQVKSAVWDLFELKPEEKQDLRCNKFKYVALTAPHDQPIHMHFRYGDEQSNFEALLKMSNDRAEPTKFNPWFATYCGGGKLIDI
ncbi:hypothetical protein [Chlorogloea sp. CCALA 695]|uniref:hypothetical protein n=1 Tax=Chlorogloea sp. CCALA 695 TaxID=2107693 RepID=UPI000D0850CD|nr:hypothetical protein [Chlorogloea sp. CCALA 695]PSB28599.1 hypothetical protein C7B70_20735 [Chlorogloea sp. CCALA 695]